MVAESSGTDRLLQLDMVQAARGIGIKQAKVLRYRPEAGDLLLVAGTGWLPGFVGHTTFGIDPGSPPGQTLQTRQPLIIYDLASEPDIRTPPMLREHGIVSLLNAPVAVDGVVWGVIEVDSETPRHFGLNDATFLLAIGNILGLAVQARNGLERVAQQAADAAVELATHKMLLGELEHRFKNDFQLIQSLLMMQLRKQPDPTLREDLRHIMDRVTAIGLAHDQLSITGSQGSVGLSDYLRPLCGNLGQRKEGVRIETDLERMQMPHERAVPLGLVINELVTKALKHALPGEVGSTIRVSFTATPEGEGLLCVRDDGAGLGPPREGSSGTELVRRLVQQIG